MKATHVENFVEPHCEAVSPERRAGGAGSYKTPLPRVRKPEELAAIHTTDSLPADTRSISDFTHCFFKPGP